VWWGAGRWTVVMEGAYSIILTKACFMHRDYLALYSQTVPREAIEFIDKVRLSRAWFHSTNQSECHTNK
jgi:hypothetical protein